MAVRTIIITIMIIEPPAVQAGALLRLLSFASPAFPTGGFAYSHGLEAAVDAGEVKDGPTLLDWLTDLLRHGSARSDVILLRQAYRFCDDAPALARIGELAAAACIGHERQLETLSQGAAFAASAQAWDVLEDAAYPVVFGVLAARQHIAEDAACLGFLTAWTGNLISASLRLGVLGQAAGLRVLAALEAVMLDVAGGTRTATLDDLGGACFMADVMAMRHETQYARLFRS
jgi:urease accessory protein